MKGCARSCLTGLIGWFVAMAAFALLFHQAGVDPDTTQGASIGLGILSTLAISLLWSARGVMRHRGLISDAIAGVPPVDGKWAGFSGTIRSSSPLVSPISGKRAVAYKYMIYTMVGSAKHRRKQAHYEGVALASPAIQTNFGTYRLLAVPEFDMSPSEVEHEAAVRNATAYVEATEFETKATGEPHRRSVEEQWTDDDGVFRQDFQGADTSNLADCRFDEQMIEQGEKVCIVGLYSQMKGGIIPDANWAHQTKIIRGDGDTGVQSLGAQARRYVVIGLVMGVMCAGIAWIVVMGAGA